MSEHQLCKKKKTITARSCKDTTRARPRPPPAESGEAGTTSKHREVVDLLIARKPEIGSKPPGPKTKLGQLGAHLQRYRPYIYIPLLSCCCSAVVYLRKPRLGHGSGVVHAALLEGGLDLVQLETPHQQRVPARVKTERRKQANIEPHRRGQQSENDTYCRL